MHCFTADGVVAIDGFLPLHPAEAGVAVSGQVTVPAGGRCSLEMVLVWHMPEVRFKSGGSPVTRCVPVTSETFSKYVWLQRLHDRKV